MKLNAALTRSLLMAASIGIVIPLCAQTVGTAPATTPTPNTTKPPAKTPPAKSTKPVKPPTTPAPKDEKSVEIQLPGIVQARATGGFLTIEVVDGKFKVGFYDAKKKEVKVDVARAAARWRSNRKVGEDHTILNPSGDGKALMGAAFVAPPYTFKLFLNLLSEDGTAVESYVINMNPSA